MYFTYLLLLFRAAYAVARFIKVCLEIYNNWPRRPRDDDDQRWPDWR